MAAVFVVSVFSFCTQERKVHPNSDIAKKATVCANEGPLSQRSGSGWVGSKRPPLHSKGGPIRALHRADVMLEDLHDVKQQLPSTVGKVEAVADIGAVSRYGNFVCHGREWVTPMITLCRSSEKLGPQETT